MTQALLICHYFTNHAPPSTNTSVCHINLKKYATLKSQHGLELTQKMDVWEVPPI